MSLEFELYTTVDITNTRARKGDDPLMYKQYQNFMTVLQTIGMRCNPTVSTDPLITESEYFEGEKVWRFVFGIDYEQGHSLNLLNSDFNLVPFISGLDETMVFEDAVFITNGDKQNILFIEKE